MPRPGPLNLITDVPGLTVGHATDARAETGVTTLLGASALAAGVDVRGGAPGVRETDALAPDALVGQAHAIVLAGGSVFGLGAADGVAAELSRAGRGLRLLAHTRAIPIVPAAVLHDLGGGGDKDWLEPPYRALGVASVAAAGTRFALGRVGAGRGARAGHVAGGLGSASLVLDDGHVVGALVAVNSIGSVYYPDGRTPYAWPFEIDGEFGGPFAAAPPPLVDPAPPESRLADLERLAPGTSTVIGVVAASAALTGAECRRLAVMAHDGIARAVRPSHTPFDGDTIFAVATGDAAAAGPRRAGLVARLGSAAADCFARAIARAAHAAALPPP
ncbi:MAG: P1 family peptidase [Proteobacteria bacterium]|nr:P1 family peptidase [Pseudomonadota bacterium]